MRKMSALNGLVALSLLALFPARTFAQASSDTDHSIHFPTMDVTNPCNGEAVFISGTLNVKMHDAIDAHGIRRISVTVVPHLTGSGASGEYKLVGVTREHDTIAASENELPFTQSYTSRFHLLSHGKGANFFDDVNFKATVNADGSFDVQFEHLSSKCVGDSPSRLSS